VGKIKKLHQLGELNRKISNNHNITNEEIISITNCFEKISLLNIKRIFIAYSFLDNNFSKKLSEKKFYGLHTTNDCQY